MQYSATINENYWIIKDSRGDNVGLEYRNLQIYRKLQIAIFIFQGSTAVCAKGFSQMNIICNPVRTTLTSAHMASLLFVSIVGPPLSEWNSLSSVKFWIAKDVDMPTMLDVLL